MNQIETTIAKAALGKGWPHGLAEECGRAAVWLAARGFDGVGAALDAIRPGPAELTVEETPEALIFQDAQAIRSAPSAFDLTAADTGPKRVVLQGTDQPLLVIGFAGIAARSYGKVFRLRFADDCRAIVDGFEATLAGAIPLPGAEVAIEAETAEQQTTALVATDIEIDDRLWHDALIMAAKSYVPSSASSRALGAGAGLIDDD